MIPLCDEVLSGLGRGYSFHGPLNRMHLYLPLADSMLISVTQ